ncbi:MAG: hypothetical protein ACI4J5_00565 [Oscillospiraceae bacterium]
MRQALDKIIVYLEDEMHMKEIELTEDYYWDIGSNEKFRMTDSGGSPAQPELSVGSLFDDVDSIRKTVSEECAASMVDIDRLAHILEYISFSVTRSIEENMDKWEQQYDETHK